MKELLLLVLIITSQFTRAEHKLVSNKNLQAVRIAPSDSTGEPREFKEFTKKFFVAIKANDTIFLREHIVFPIPNSSFSELDEGVAKMKSINSHILFRRLHKLFPDDLIKDILARGKYRVIKHGNIETKYMITVYNNTGDVESNLNWFFVKRKGEYFFINYTAEAG